MSIKPGKHIHFNGSEYEVIGVATHSETLEEMVVYRASSGDDKLLLQPLSTWSDLMDRNEICAKQSASIDEIEYKQKPLEGIHNQSTVHEKMVSPLP